MTGVQTCALPISTVALVAPDETEYAFATDVVLTIPAGQTVGTVAATALEAGAGPNGIAPTADNAVLVDALAFAVDVRLVSIPTGGADAESDEDYLQRLAAELQLLAPRPILPQDFATMARQVPGVGRAVAIDLYDPGPPPNANAERSVTVAVTDDLGQPCTPAVKAAVDDLLQSEREVNFQVFVVDATYVDVNVAFTCTALVGYGVDDVKARAEQAVTDFLSPALWGQPPGGNDPNAWRADATTIRMNDLVAVIDNTEGVDWVALVHLNGAAADLPLTGIAPLPRVGVVTGTVNPPA